MPDPESMTVIDMNAYRNQDPGYDGAQCTCGEAWFTLTEGAVCLSIEGTITGYSGRLQCMSCQAPYTRQ